MRVTPLKMASFYIIMGILFTVLAIESVNETVWNFSTVILMLVATYDYGVAIRFYFLNKRIKNKHNEKQRN
ncbi:YdiK family protein [Bacillus solimangrovi]|uniref:DUF4305 domain-containing protein n=1 Tax=Bacillus solimangrovi TaxID=1305675 RepID=A0A1E5LC99_9BACI|nr:YdiK family protein [Bacillus solimangrovi]OEH91728.1 DUF4305 domain-containing protein [Bacillus solimangrovi]